MFILPFIVSISAVGFTGLWASGLLQSRIEISNSVLQSLTGFRDLSSSMNRFLAESTEEGRNEVKGRVAEQRNVLRTMLGQAKEGTEDNAELKTAEALIAKAGGYVDDLWSMHETETSLKRTIQKGLSVVVTSQTNISEALKKVQRSVQDDDTAAKRTLREAEYIRGMATFLADMRTAFDAATQAEEKFAVIARALPDMKKRLRVTAMSLPEANRPAAKSIERMLGELQALIAGNDRSDIALTAIFEKVRNFTPLNVDLNLAAQQKMNDAAVKFGQLDAPAEKAIAVLNDGRQLMNSGYSIQIMMARFLLLPTAENRTRLTQEFASMRKDMVKLKRNAEGLPFYAELEKNLLPALETTEAASGDLVKVSKDRKVSFDEAAAELDTVWRQLTTFAERQKQNAGEDRREANSLSIGTTAIGILISIFAGIGLVLTFKGPIGQITAAMRRLANGVLDTRITGENRVDEIGDMARALGVFKQNALSKREIEHENEVQRAEAEDERRRNEIERQRVDEQIAFAVAALAAGLGRLAKGDISKAIDTPFDGRLEQLRTDFNQSLQRLQMTVRQVRDNTYMIQRNAAEMSSAADHLAKRTEQQAASLEQTAAAVDEVTVTVKSSAAQAEEANHIVAETQRCADASSMVVSSAIAAMGRIENASDQIVQIIDVIDEIAFQTNLLALNAGIEAARAGEAGKGFAVVAQEVRELAQRSAEAAHQIKDLIQKSSAEVSSGAKLVQQTGSVLSEISLNIVTVAERVATIATASRDQSNALAEVNASVNEMDQMTQRNAAMVEETNAATRQLADEAETLMEIVGQFRLPDHPADGRVHEDYAA
ncbi:methyl-accepting chemotaxis protein [Rhizobium mongolense subsp. loessense]|uniref:Methyl-accepting chemotaxis protein n=2 Tax=Rhizobium mongolense TaxID=57676 RepID=A0A1G4QXL8_9HYPH|nr:methyl-accepting chemotaxis protein [Rhizobium mongolense subsp. loessense]